MSEAWVDVRWHLDGLRAVILENQFLRVVVLPEVGARIYQLTYKPHDEALIWNHPRIRPTKVPFGARYDDAWCGGWDKTFPNSDPGAINGEMYPDHGEVCFAEWDFEARRNRETAFARFCCRTRISDVWFEKTLALRAGEAKVRITYFLRNESGTVLPILWNLHAAMVVSEYHRVEFPSMKVRREPCYPGTLGAAPLEFDWPEVDTPSGPMDLGSVPPVSERGLLFFYGLDLTEGWCGVTNTRSGLACGFAFDRSVFRSCWLFASYGAWRNLNVAVLEPSTGHPCKIEDAIHGGTCAHLEPGQELRTSIVFSVTKRISRIRSISSEGEIR